MFKKIALSIAAISALSFTSASAQKYISVGPVVGLGHSGVSNGKMKDRLEIKSKFNPSFHAGIGLIYAKHEHWGFGGEILFSKEGSKKEIIDHTWNKDYVETHSVGYIRIPLRVYYFFGKYDQKIRPKVYVGPSIGFKVMDDHNMEAINGTPQDVVGGLAVADFNTIDLGLQAGVGLNIPLSKATWLNLDVNYYQGLLDATTDGPDFKTGYNMNQNFGLQVGVLFGLGKMAKK